MLGPCSADFACSQLIPDSVTSLALLGLLVTLPFYLLAMVLLFVGKTRTERVPENIFHRAFDFCESTRIGSLLGGAILFSPTLFIAVTSMILYPSDILAALALATLPWALFSLGALAELKYYRRI